MHVLPSSHKKLSQSHPHHSRPPQSTPTQSTPIIIIIYCIVLSLYYRIVFFMILWFHEYWVLYRSLIIWLEYYRIVSTFDNLFWILSYQILIVCFENHRIKSNFDNFVWKLSYLINFCITYIENHCIISLFDCQVNVKIQSNLSYI